MSTVNAANPKLDQSVRIFDEFYQYEQVVNASEYDIVNSYLRSLFGNAQAAGDFTVALFRISQQNGTPVLDLLEQIKGQDALTLTNTICYYLNGLRSLATLYGISSVVTPNQWAARNVRP
jgi:ABC-type transporter Mla MlaB component